MPKMLERGFRQMTPLKAIRLRCLECSAGSIKEVRLCPVHDCELYQYRMGHNPKRKGLGGKPPTQRAVSDTEDEEQTADEVIKRCRRCGCAYYAGIGKDVCPECGY